MSVEIKKAVAVKAEVCQQGKLTIGLLDISGEVFATASFSHAGAIELITDVLGRLQEAESSFQADVDVALKHFKGH